MEKYIYKATNRTSDETTLAHYGIKGQKWGVRRFQNEDRTWTEEGKIRYGRGGGSKMNSGLSLEDAAAITVPAVTLITALGVSAAMTVEAKHANQRYYNKLKKKSEFKSMDDVPTQDPPPTTTQENMALVNPKYGDAGTLDNCAFCTMAMAAREKGYDVIANKSDTGFYRKVEEKWFDGKNNFKVSDYKKFRAEASSYPDGAYGELCVEWLVGGGHSMFWKQENGEVTIYDGQSRKEIDEQSYSRMLAKKITGRIEFRRLDNVDFNDELLGTIRSMG